MPVQEAEIRCQITSVSRPFCLLGLAATQKIAHAAHSWSRLDELHVKAGYVPTLLAGAPSLHVNRPLVLTNIKATDYSVTLSIRKTRQQILNP